MKTVKKSLAAIAIAALFLPTIESCKKGPEDPGLTLRGRNARITGTWELKTMEYAYSMDETKTTTNDVNSYNSVTNTDKSFTLAYDGSNMTAKATETSDTETSYMAYDFVDSKYKNESSASDNSKDETWKEAFTLTVSIYKDNTYTVNKTRKATSYDRDEHSSSGTTTVVTNHNDTSVTGGYDPNMGTYYGTDEETITENGTWNWTDDDRGRKNKIMLSSGPLTGYLVRLSNDEIILDHTFSSPWSNYFLQEFDPYSHNKDEEADSGTEVVNTKGSFSTYNNSDAGETEEGISSTETVYSYTVSLGKSTWEKTDKESKRSSEGSSEE